MDLEKIKYGKTLLKPNFTRNTHYCNTAIIVVGCGGTGGRIIPLIAQHISNHNKEITNNARHTLYLNHKMSLIVIDSKNVLPKNLDRQNFFQFDLMKNKATVMAERYSALYGINITAIEEKYSPMSFNSRDTTYHNSIIFDCTDNKVARQSIEDNLPSTNNVIISCGNEADFGQVAYAYKRKGYGSARSSELSRQIFDIRKQILNPRMDSVNNVTCFPTLLELFRDFKDTPTASCTDVILVNEQSMPINSLVAMLAYNMFYEVVSGKALNYNMVKCNVNNIFSTSFITNPKSCLKQLYRGFFGIDDFERADEAFSDLYENTVSYIRNRKVIEFMALVEKYPIFCIPFLEEFISQSYGLNTKELEDTKSKLQENKLLLDEYFGVKTDAVIQP